MRGFVGSALRLLVLTFSVLALAPSVGCSKQQGDAYVYDDAGGGGKKSKSKRGEPDLMYGRVVDRNDKPLSRVTIKVSPGLVERVTSKWGEYDVEHLYADDGEKLPLKKNQDYTISAWKPGYHETTQIFHYDGGNTEIPTITLVEDTITLSPGSVLDPGTLNQDPPTSGDAGQVYE